MSPLTEESVVRAIDAELLPQGFEPRPNVPSVDGPPVVALWTRKTWNTNRAVVVLRLEPAARPGPLSQRMKIPLGKAIGYFPFFYGLGLQLVWVGRDVTLGDDISSYVDKIDNQRSIVQSLFVVDLDRRKLQSARTWGQVVTGKFQDAIERGIHVSLALG